MIFIYLAIIGWFTWGSRMCGGGAPKLPWGLDQWLLPLPYLAFWGVLGWWIVPAYLGAVVGLRMAHGRGFRYFEPFKPGSDKELSEYLIPQSLPIWIQKFLIMFLTGWAVTLVLSVALMLHGHYLAGVVLAASGAAKSCAYFAHNTETAELLRGFALGVGFVAALWVI